MGRFQAMVRRLLIEQLTERIAFHAEELGHESEALLFTEDGLAYFYDPPVDLEAAQAVSDEGRLTDAWSMDPAVAKGQPAAPGDAVQLFDSPPSGLDVPLYHSNPSFPKKIYLDFNGQSVSGTSWNNRIFFNGYNTGPTINAPAFTLDGDLTTFNSAELALIQEVWARISEDYAPFQVDVTTEEPPAALFTQGGQAMRVIISTTIDATSGQAWYSPAGGVAFVNSWNSTNGTPCCVFYNYMGGVPRYFADAGAHEIGHTLGLIHDGRTAPLEEYYDGHGAGVTKWGPIMGSGYYASVTQWSKGEYTAASNQEDDLATISGKLPYITDDNGGTLATATQLNVGTASTLAASGLITTRSDVDAFRFATQAGSITLNVNPFDYSTGKADLDAKLTLLDSSGATVAAVDNVDVLNATLTVNVTKGFYTMLVDGSGRPSVPGDDGYTDYASIGKYTIAGTIVPNAAPTPVTDTATVVPGGSVLIDVLANDSDPNNDVLSILSIGTPAVGSVVVEAGKIRYTAGPTAGQLSFAYTLVDELGVSSTSSVTVTVNTPPSNISLSSSTVAENAVGAVIGALLVTDPDAGDSHLLTVDDNRFEIVSGTLKLKAGVSLNYESTPAINVNITAKDSANAQFVKSLAIGVIDMPELSGNGVVLGDGTAQRSMMQQVTVTFDGAVTIASGAFTVVKRGPGGGTVTSTATPVINGAGQTVVTVTFSGAFTRGAGVLVDGYYRLTIDGSKITRAGQALDSNGDGQGGDVTTIGSSEADGFFALYGDTDGNGVVGVAEFGQFRSAFGKSVGQAGYNILFDYELDAVVGVSDFGNFRSRFGKPRMIFV